MKSPGKLARAAALVASANLAVLPIAGEPTCDELAVKLDVIPGRCWEPRPASEKAKDLIRQELFDAFELKKEYESGDLRKQIADAHAAGLAREELDLIAKAETRKAQMIDHFQQAIWLTEKAYGVGAIPASGQSAAGPMARTKVNWYPKVQIGQEDIIKRPTAAAADRFFAFRFPATSDIGGQTAESGEVRISLETLDMAYKSGDPGVLALTLYHELVHFRDLMADDRPVTHEGMEAHAYSDAAEKADVLIAKEIPGDPDWRKHWKDFYLSNAKDYREQIGRGETNPAWPNDDDNEVLRREFDLQEAKQAAIRSARAKLAEHAEAEERERREAEERRQRQERESEEGSRRVEEWASGCGMPWTGEGSTFVFQDPPQVRVVLRANYMRGAAAAFVVAAICHAPESTAPCLDGLMEHFDEDWKQERFRDSILLAVGTEDREAACAAYVEEHYRPGKGFKGLTNAAREANRIWDEAVERQRRVRSRPAPRQDPPQPQPGPRAPSPSPRPSLPDDCIYHPPCIHW